MVTHSEICYECTNSTNLYECFYVENSENCRECLMSYDLIGCNNCIECYGLRNKSNYIRNKPASKDDIDRRKKELLESRLNIEKARAEFDTWTVTFPRKFANIVKCENSTGNALRNCKNTLGYSTYNAIDCRYFNNGDSPISCYDVFQSGKPELCYEGITPDESYLTHFTAWCWRCRNLLYSDNNISLYDSIGCSGFKHGQYCILNKQYSKEEYELLAAKIIEKMIECGEWGEYFPMSISPFGYNETSAQDYHPKTKGEALEIGAKWQAKDYSLKYDGDYYSDTYDISDYLQDEAKREALLSGVLRCEKTDKPYKITPQELAYYIKNEIPIPQKHPDERFQIRFNLRNPRKLWHRQCDCIETGHEHDTEGRCPNEFETTYAPEGPETIYCERCYQKSVI